MTAPEPSLRVLSLGAGVQSTTLALLAVEGVLPKPDAAIFADTGWEPDAVYQHLDRLAVVLDEAGIPLHRVSVGNIREDALDPEHRFASMPLFVLGPPVEVTVVDSWKPCPVDCAWAEFHASHTKEWVSDDEGDEVERWISDKTSNTASPSNMPPTCLRCDDAGRVPDVAHTEIRHSEGMARRQCTSEYKLKPIKAKVRELLGYPYPTPIPRGVYAEQWIGFSTDELGRVRDTLDVRYTRPRHPLLELDMSRTDCRRWLSGRGWGATTKSACIGCPFHGNAQWRQMRDTDPASWADAVAFDAAIRHGHQSATDDGNPLLGTAYLHRSRVPLDRAPIDRVTAREWRGRQVDLLDLVAEEGDPDGCSPYGCRSSDAA